MKQERGGMGSIVVGWHGGGGDFDMKFLQVRVCVKDVKKDAFQRTCTCEVIRQT